MNTDKDLLGWDLTPQLTRKQQAEQAGVSRTTLFRAINDGVDPSAPLAVKKWSRRNRLRLGSIDTTEIEEAKLRKVNLECALLQNAIDQSLSETIPKDLAEAVLKVLRAHSADAWDRIADDLPTLLEGLSAAKMKKELLQYSVEVQNELASGKGLQRSD